MPNPEQEALEVQITDLVEELQNLKTHSKSEEEKQLQLLNTQRQTILDFESQISQLKQEKEQALYQSKQALTQATKATGDQVVKLTKEL